jgi:hypothetical protein
MNYDFDTQSVNLIRYYLRRGYPKKKELKLFPRRIYSLWWKKIPTDREIMVTKFHPNNPDIMKIIRKHWNIFQ